MKHEGLKIGVIGAGSWGTALAKLLAENGHEVEIWAYEPELVKEINEKHENTLYLPGFRLPDNLSATGDLHTCVRGKELILSVPPSHVVRRVISEIKDEIPVGVPIVSASKGIENETLMLVSDIMEDVLPIHCHPYLCYLSGPSFAKEVAAQKPTAVTVASYNHKLAEHVQRVFSSELFRCYTSSDVPGVEIGGALKNVIAIASGAITAMDLGHNASSGMITRGLNEMTRLAVRLGANPLTLSGLAGMGDLVLTCTGGLSRNRTLGYKLGQGMTIKEILDDMNMVAEGVKTSESVYHLAKKMNVEMPICEQVYLVIHEGKDVREAVTDLSRRDLKRELAGLY
jgi:glycerol-3-phosphate dehydrogenase (NAD(P)+)|nr:NAD(P)H-dependent glycerol-3-phosphate dehydrogenase [Microvenator marinus]